MIRILLAFALTLGFSACKKDETVAGYDGDNTWTLVEVDGAPFTSSATLQFSNDGKVSGQAPCNTYFSEQTKPYPWIGFGPIGGTRKMCPDMEKEILFFNALAEMAQAEVSGDVMMLRNDAGRQMVFKASKDDG